MPRWPPLLGTLAIKRMAQADRRAELHRNYALAMRALASALSLFAEPTIMRGMLLELN